MKRHNLLSLCGVIVLAPTLNEKQALFLGLLCAIGGIVYGFFEAGNEKG